MRNELVTDEEREWFDSILEALIPTLPPRISQVMEEVPVIVEDVPGEEADLLPKRDKSTLMGLYVGQHLLRRLAYAPPLFGDKVYLYRGCLLSVARRRNGVVDENHLREEIRKTLLHEIGHHHGMDEDELEELGY
jgi:predicted Zn-dependent protease with MMP-like domain